MSSSKQGKARAALDRRRAINGVVETLKCCGPLPLGWLNQIGNSEAAIKAAIEDGEIELRGEYYCIKEK